MKNQKKLPPEFRQVIINKYGATIEKYFPICGFAPKSKLPVPEQIIREAIAETLLEETDSDRYFNLTMGYLYLEWFIPDEDYTFVESFSKKYVNQEELTKTICPPKN